MKHRTEKLQEILNGNEAMLIFGGSNRFYFTGFHSSAGAVVITRSRAFFLIDFRYFEKAKQVVTGMQVVLCTDLYRQLSEVLQKENIKKAFLETDGVDIETFARLRKTLKGVTVSSDSRIHRAITQLRAVKDQTEIQSIKAAQSITDSAFEYILERIDVGRTEKEIALELEFFARKRGSEGVAFDFIVVSGKNSSLPHGVPTNKKIEMGDFITMDFGARVDGYCSDMTRTVAVGGVSDKQRKVYDTVLQAQSIAFEKIKAGAVCKEVDFAARDFIAKSGFEGRFGHGLGHSLGIDIHESPAFNTRDTSVLKSGTVITVEPGIYLENEFGVRIEDTVLVTDTGYENLANSPKELMIL